jgi:hypothetical protein
MQNVRLLQIVCVSWIVCSEVALSQVFGSETKQEIPNEDFEIKMYRNAAFLDVGTRLLSMNYERMIHEELSVRIGVAVPLLNDFPGFTLPMPLMFNFLFPVFEETAFAEVGLGFLLAIGFEDSPAPIRNLQDTSFVRRNLDEAIAVSLNGHPTASFALRVQPQQYNVFWRFAVVPFSSPLGLRWNFSASIGFRF